MENHTSEFIFSLASKYGIGPRGFSGESYFGFCEEYKSRCLKRDRQLKAHLLQTPNLYRTFLPWRPYIFDTVFQLQWYYDQIVIYDPVFFEIIHFQSNDIEENKSRLLELLTFLASLKDSLQDGFLLFGSYDSFAITKEPTSADSLTELLAVPEIREECAQQVEVVKMESPEGKSKDYFNVTSSYRNKSKLFSVYKDIERLKTDEGYTVEFNFEGSKYTRLTLQEVRDGGFYDRAIEPYETEFPHEIRDILGYVEIGSEINTPVLFNRRLDELVLSRLAPGSKASKAIKYHNLFLPFINGIPPERLFELRLQMPNAFLDFRRLMFTSIYDLERGGIDKDMMLLKLEQQILPLLNKLEAEMKNSVGRLKLVGACTPLIAGLGALGLWTLGVDFTKYLSLLFGGLVASELNALATYRADQRIGKANSLYYLWKVQQKR